MKILFLLRQVFLDACPELLDDARALGLKINAIRSDQEFKKEELLLLVADIDIIVVDTMKISQDVIDAGGQLKYIIKFGAGYDNIDVEYADQKGISVTYAPSQNANAVADLVFGLMLAAARNITQKDKEMKTNEWDISLGSEVNRKCLGIIGFGSIGKAIAERAAGFKMEMLAYGHYQDHHAAKQMNVRFVELTELLSTADFIVLSTSLSEQNRNMINKETIAIMKPNAFLINVARGGLVDEDALITALKQNQIRGAALDVFVTEPPTDEICKLPNVVATPHIGGATFEAIEKISRVTIDNLSRFLKNEQLRFVVKPKLTKK